MAKRKYPRYATAPPIADAASPATIQSANRYNVLSLPSRRLESGASGAAARSDFFCEQYETLPVNMALLCATTRCRYSQSLAADFSDAVRSQARTRTNPADKYFLKSAP